MSIDRINRQSFINAYNTSSNKSVKDVNKTKTFDYEGAEVALTIDGVSSSSFP